MATDFNNTSLKFLYGNDFISSVKAKNAIQDGIIYFDNINRQIILGQDNNGTGSKYKTYSDLYQTIFYADGSWDSSNSRWKIVINIAEDAKSFLLKNITSLRVLFTDENNDSSRNNFFITTKFKESSGFVCHAEEELSWKANSILDFTYIPSAIAENVNLLSKSLSIPTNTWSVSSSMAAGNKPTQTITTVGGESICQVTVPNPASNDSNIALYKTSTEFLIPETIYTFSCFIKAANSASANKKVTLQVWNNANIYSAIVATADRTKSITLTTSWVRYSVKIALT